MNLIFEWDENKAKTNQKKHGVGFMEARTVFNDPNLLTIQDEMHSENEDRFISIGFSSRGHSYRNGGNGRLRGYSDYSLPQGDRR